MISRAHRFHGYGSLNYVYRNGTTVRGPYFSIKAVLNPKRQSYRLAVVVSRKVHKSAVTRNRIRRRLYEAVRQFESGILNYDIVLTVFDDSLVSLEAGALSKELRKQLRQAGILSAEQGGSAE